jgi:hypothetical protein
VQHEARCAAVCIDHECDLRVDDFVKEVVIILGEDFEARLSRRLRVEMFAFARDSDDECRRELIAAGVFLEHRGVDLHFLPLLRRLEQRNGWIEKMKADVIDAGVRRRIRQDDDAGAALRIESDPGAIPAGAAVVPDDLAAVALQNVPADGDVEIRASGGTACGQHRGHRRCQR